VFAAQALTAGAGGNSAEDTRSIPKTNGVRTLGIEPLFRGRYSLLQIDLHLRADVIFSCRTFLEQIQY
jgi:hypothetical protein